MEAIKSHMENTVNVSEVQVGYYGDMNQIDLRVPGILLEPDVEEGSAKDTRWKAGEFRIKLWILVGIVRDYMISMKELEDILGADGSNIYGVQAALKMLKVDQTFKTMSGSMGSSQWRIRPPVLEIGSTRFGVVMRGSERVNAATLELSVKLDVEK